MTLGVLEAKPSPETYGRKLKRVELPMSTIEALLTMDGQRSYKMNGWPEGAKIVGIEAGKNPFRVILYLYHPDFPVASPLMRPPALKIQAQVVS